MLIMVLVFKPCVDVNVDGFEVWRYEGSICGLLFKDCIGFDEELEEKYYDVECACKKFDANKALELIEVLVQKGVMWVVATVEAFHEPAGPTKFYEVSAQAVWVRDDPEAIVDIYWVLIDVLRMLLAQSSKPVTDAELKHYFTYPHLLYALYNEFKALLEEHGKRLGNGYLLVNPSKMDYCLSASVSSF